MSYISDEGLVQAGSQAVSHASGSTQAPSIPQVPQGITIQLTKVQSEDNWDDVDESELIFSLDQDDDDGTSVCASEMSNCPVYVKSAASPGTVVNELALAAYECVSDVFLCNESQKSSSPLLPSSPTSKPLINLVKSLSTEIDSKDPSPQKTHPFVNLVKSISTEISRLEPEVTQSKSDSKLNVHLWRQITQTKNKNGDSRTVPSSPSMSPSESKGMFFNVQEVEAKLEDTKRRLSEAMQEPLSMLSKIIGEETSPNPKYRTMSPVFCAQESSSSHLRDQGFFDGKNTLPIYEREEEEDTTGFPDDTVKTVYHHPVKNYCKYKICSYGDMIQVVELPTNNGAEEDEDKLDSCCQTPHSHNDVPCGVLVCVAILAYNLLIWPLPAYISGLFMGLISGFMMGFFIILLLVPKRNYSCRHKQFVQESFQSLLMESKSQEAEVLKGWMNEMFSYDPETYHPALTHSVFVTLEGTTITRSYSGSNLPRRSIFGEEISEVGFVNHQVHDLTNAQVFLYPYGLAKKRLWNKKYPICIQLCDTNDLTSDNLELGYKGDICEELQRPNLENIQSGLSDGKGSILYLFGRTGRQKEEWYQYLVRASRGTVNERQSANRFESKTGVQPGPLSSQTTWGDSVNSTGESAEEDVPCMSKPRDLAGNLKQKVFLDYTVYMSRFIPSEQNSPVQSPCQSAASSPTPRKKPFVEQSFSNTAHVSWVNALIGRIFWDFLREKYWEDMVVNKIQKKLSKIKLPHFMNELTLTGLNMGTSLPQILSTSVPTMNERGLWIELDVNYSGSFQVTLETKMNLSKLGKDAPMEADEQTKDTRDGNVTSRIRILSDSDEESSSAGSSEDEEVSIAEPPGSVGDRLNPTNAEGFTGGSSTSRKILRFVDKITKSRYFQKATENEYIKRKIEEVSNTPLLLTVEIQELEGSLAVNIPPPPTDRIWYSFQMPPRVEMKVRPKLGEREVTFIHVTEWIEKKLQDEFQKILVMPNMDDIYFPIMQSGVDSCRQPQAETEIAPSL
ncbi:testis-expressed sequence 2 -like [Pelobates cultripes]|uniref:Testis-expressed sequence 2 -like n=1 Tax=Pelobates cultripes TaxID=61616 RepID=A0AAD1WIB0_PELCU|nr:testis-expressed sequence 2 -like [Pelobates cultripes]